MAPVLRLGNRDMTALSAGVLATVSVRRAKVQAPTGAWMPLRLKTLSLLKPLGLPWEVAALATGADRPTSAAVATASAKARFFPDILYVPPFNIADSSRDDSRVGPIAATPYRSSRGQRGMLGRPVRKDFHE